MFSPVRCFTCNRVMRYRSYDAKVQGGMSSKDALDALGYDRYCCRRMIVCAPKDLDDRVLRSRCDDFDGESYTVRMRMKGERDVETR